MLSPDDLAALMKIPNMRVWPFSALSAALPDGAREALSAGGDEDFVVFVPKDVDADEAGLAVDRLGTCGAHAISVEGGTLYVCTHA